MKIMYVLVLFLFLLSNAFTASEQEIISFENQSVLYKIGAGGQNKSFVDKRSGKDYCERDFTAFARVKIAGKDCPSTAISFDGERLEVRFKNTDFQAAIRPIVKDRYMVFRVESVKGTHADELTFFDLSLIPGEGEDAFSGCALGLNLQTNVAEIPQANVRLRAKCYPRFGMEGAEVAIVGCPHNQLRDVMKEVVSQAEDLPHSTVGGPWAMDAPINRGSYLFNFDGMTEESVEEWIALAQSMGITQIDFHGGSSFRFGDCEPNPKVFPEGKKSFKKIIDRLHEAGIAAGLHTYAFFIDKKCPWVTPTPDPRLAKDARFTLQADLPKDADTVPVEETTETMSTTTGFFVRNSTTLQIDDELIVYKGISKEPPYAFTECQRGAYGTKAVEHSAKSEVHHLKECFGLFVPDGDSTMLADVAAKTAEMFNDCGFDMIYLDALDGEDILGGGENGWHYGSKFVFEIFSRLKKSPLMEMSTFHHHLWYVRARMGAWDHPTRGHKRFIDIHCKANQSLTKMFLPGQLGWWAIKTWLGVQGEPTFADDIEYLCGKSVGSGAGLSIMGINPGNADKPIYKRLAKIIKDYETLRHANYFNDDVKKKLSVPGDEYTLVQDGDRWKLYPVVYSKHKVESLSDEHAIWSVTNTFKTQPLKVRLEALTAALPYDANGAVSLVDFSPKMKFASTNSAEGVRFSIQPSGERSKDGLICGKIEAFDDGQSDPKAAWGQAKMTFSPALDLSKNQALGVWIFGDGKGEVLNFQMKSPEHLISGLAERYVVVDFTGWKYFELLELESERYANYRWPYGSAYSIYRENVHFDRIDRLSIWCNDIPKGESICCWLAPVKALPHRSIAIKNPSIAIGDKSITFPVELETGQYLEFYSENDCKHYGADGGLIGEVKPLGKTPTLGRGGNTVQFQCEKPEACNPRVRVTVVCQGE